MRKKIPINVEFEPHVIRMIDRVCGGPAQGAHGTGGVGRAGWIRSVIHKELGLKEKKNDSKTGNIPIADLITDGLAEVDQLIVWLAQKNYTMRAIKDHLVSHDIKPPRGVSWTLYLIRETLNRATAHTLTWYVNQIAAAQQDAENSEPVS